ncbi:hypothetical protein ACQKP0_06000 [Heyndrickxia sp. NPDC080065]|uniref:hypothetical protein n=1 Tax=Heyndrickxia sp. NPDC080065 TaxID=3390568 RepID=UPI003D034A98
MLSSSIQSISKLDLMQIPNRLEFRTGEIFLGNIKKIYPNQTARVNIGNQMIIAKLEVPLVSGDSYWFQVLAKEGEILLKMLSPYSKEEQTNLPILKQLALPNNSIYKELISFIEKEQIPLTKENIEKAGHLIEKNTNLKEGLEAIKIMNQKDFPLSESIYKSLFEALKPQISTQSLLHILEGELQLEPKTQTVQSLLTAIQTLENTQLESNTKEPDFRQHVLTLLKGVTRNIGLFYEAEILSYKESEVSIENRIKPLLLKYIQEDPKSIESKEVAEQLINKWNGQQLLSAPTNPIQHLVYQLPLQLFGYQTELSLQWSGKRLDDGKIDPNYCHVLFYLELEHLKETIIDMKVQNRIVSIKIININEQLQAISHSFIPKLKEGLKELNYFLSSVQFESSINNTKMLQGSGSNSISNQYSGVDFRI